MSRQTSRPGSDGLVVTNGHFAEALAALLQSAEMTPKQLAGEGGRSPAAVSQWLHKGDVPSLDIIFIIEEKLGVRRGVLAQYAEPGLRDRDTEATPEEMFREGLLRMRLTVTQRKALSEMLVIFQESNRLSMETEPPPALPEL